jgi:hypothetical protein
MIFPFKAYRGAQMTLLTMDLDQKPAAGTFAGFHSRIHRARRHPYALKKSAEFRGHGRRHGLELMSPYQAFKWVHFPGSYRQTPAPMGNWDYHATPRFFDAAKQLLPLDPNRTVDVTIPVGDFEKGGLSVGFTRAFLKSQAYANRFGANTKLKPANATGVNWLFDMTKKAGSKDGNDFTYEDMYIWLGYTAREQIYDLLDEAIGDGTTDIEMFAYDLNRSGDRPAVSRSCVGRSDQGDSGQRSASRYRSWQADDRRR